MERLIQELNPNKIKAAMVEKGFTQASFSTATGISQRTICLKLNGKVGISVKDLELFAKVLGKEISYFFEQKVQK